MIKHTVKEIHRCAIARSCLRNSKIEIPRYKLEASTPEDRQDERSRPAESRRSPPNFKHAWVLCMSPLFAYAWPWNKYSWSMICKCVFCWKRASALREAFKYKCQEPWCILLQSSTYLSRSLFHKGLLRGWTCFPRFSRGLVRFVDWGRLLGWIVALSTVQCDYQTRFCVCALISHAHAHTPRHASISRRSRRPDRQCHISKTFKLLKQKTLAPRRTHPFANTAEQLPVAPAKRGQQPLPVRFPSSITARLSVFTSTHARKSGKTKRAILSGSNFWSVELCNNSLSFKRRTGSRAAYSKFAWSCTVITVAPTI